jgi:zinc-dependent metalloproteinase lipoprotein, BF0631 family
MKKHLFIYLLLCLAFLGCSKDNFDGIKFSTGEEIKLTSEQQTIGLVVRSGSEWQIANPPSWCDASRRGDTLVLSPKVNDNTTERSGTVTIVNEDTQVPLTIIQSGEHYFELPVVFHVLYTNASNPRENVSAEYIRDCMDYVNNFYAGNNGKSLNMNLSFVLAATDPDGKPLAEPGIHRVQQSSVLYDIDDYLLRNKYNGTDLIWNPNDYINIIVCTFTETNVTGVSMLPFTPQGKPLPGLNRNDTYYTSLPTKFVQALMINNKYTGDTENGPKGEQQSIWFLTLAHELGHYLGLIHVFSGGENGASTDYCDDTPDYDRPAYEKAIYILREQRQARNGEEFTSTNIMDYAIGYRDRFTPDQRARIRHVLDYSPLIPGPKIEVRGISRSTPVTEEPQIMR